MDKKNIEFMCTSCNNLDSTKYGAFCVAGCNILSSQCDSFDPFFYVDVDVEVVDERSIENDVF